MDYKNFRAKVVDKKTLTPKMVELGLQLIEPQTIEFKAGQFVQLLVGAGEKREYSIITVPKQNSAVGFCVNISPMGPGSKYVENLKAGDEVEFEGPFGVFSVRDRDFDSDQLFVATGSGIAPFKSIIADLLAKDFKKQITLLFGLRNASEAFYFDYFEQLANRHPNFKFVPCLSHPAKDWQGFKGRVTNYLEQYGEDYKNCTAYICGGPPVIKDVRALLMTAGLPSAKIRLEVFT